MKISLFRLMKILSVIIFISFITPSFIYPHANAQTVYGTETVWSPTDQAQNEAMQCWDSGNSDCLLQVMKNHNAPPQAIEFSEQLEGEGYMSSFEEKGIVDLAMVIYPMRANDNFQPVLVNGQPGIVHIEDVWHTDLSSDPLYPSMIARYPEMTLWGSDNGFSGLEEIQGGGQSFRISYSLVDGCHACEVVGTAFIAFDFDNSGTFIGTRFLELSDFSQPPVESVSPITPAEEPSARNGKWIAFLDAQQNVWMIASDGTEMKQITDDAQIIYDDQGLNIGIVNYFHLEWSPDGSRLAFVRNDSDFKEYVESRSFWIYSVENGLTDRFDIHIQNYTWNPNSRAIDFSPKVPDILDPNLSLDSIQGILELDITTREITELVPPQNGRPIIAPAWSPDGKKISFDEVIYIEGRGNFGYYDFETNSYITWEEDLENQIGNYSWFPDSQHIAYDGVGYVPGPGARIWKTDLERTSSTPLTNMDVVQFAYWPMISPQGNQIAYLASYPGQMMEQTWLWVANLDGSNARQISEHESAAEQTWSPDGNAILYTVREPDGSRRIYIYDFSLSKSRPLTKGSFPRWQPYLINSVIDIPKPTETIINPQLEPPEVIAAGFTYPYKNFPILNKVPLDSSLSVKIMKELLDGKGYSIFDYRNKDVYQVVESIGTASIFYFFGHGITSSQNNGTAIVFWDGSEYTLLAGGDEGEPQADNDGILYAGKLDLDSLKLAVINGCNVGKDPYNERNLLNTFIRKGADMSLGFNRSIGWIVGNVWNSLFWKGLSDGQSVRYAAEQSINKIEKTQFGSSGINIQNLVILPEDQLDMIIVPPPPHQYSR
jgi:Tol biopolymer transport system component